MVVVWPSGAAICVGLLYSGALKGPVSGLFLEPKPMIKNNPTLAPFFVYSTRITPLNLVLRFRLETALFNAEFSRHFVSVQLYGKSTLKAKNHVKVIR